MRRRRTGRRHRPARALSTPAQLRAAAGRVAALLNGADGSRRIPGSEWTVAEAASHLAVGTRNYLDMARGMASPIKDITEVPAANAEYLATNPERDLAVLRAEMVAAVDELIKAAADAADSSITWHAGLRYEMDDHLAIDLGEYLVHGYDIAKALGKPWQIDPANAQRVLLAALHALPLAVDAKAAAGLTGVIEIRLRGGERRTVEWDNGSVRVSGKTTGKPDCIVSADPVAFLLGSYGRGSKWKPILTGKVVAYGRKPLLALKMQKALRNP